MKSSHKPILQTLVSSRWMTIGLVVLIVFMVWFTVAEFVIRRSIERKIAQAQLRHEESLQKQEELKRILSLIEQPEYLELQAKQKLNLKKAGERVFVVGNSQVEQKREVTPLTPEARAHGWFDFLGL